MKRHSGCDKKTVKKDWIENLVIEQIQKVLFDDALIEKLADTVMEIQGAENTALPLLRKQYAETQKGIDNLVNAIQQGIITPSTKERLEELEKQKNELSVQIIKEEMAKPTLTRDQIIFWFHRFRKYNVKRLDQRRRLIDSFVNSIYLYDDKMIIYFNYKEGSKTVTFADVEESGLCSDMTALALPKRQAPLLRCLLFFVCAKNEHEALGERRGVRVSCGYLCIQSMQKHRPSRQARSGYPVDTSAYKVCRSTDRAGRRDQVLLPLPKILIRKNGDFYFFYLLFLHSYLKIKSAT